MKKKNKWMKAICAVLSCIILMMVVPMEVVAEENDDFVIEDGVLVEYTGAASEVIIPMGVTSIDDSVFEGNTSIKKVVIPEGVTYIGHYSFYGCTELEEIIFPKSLNDVGENTFWETKWLENESNKNSLVIVNNILVDGRKATGDVIIPDGVAMVGDKAFAANKNITSIVIPGTVKIVCYYSFYGCENLKKVDLLEGVEYIEESAFIDCIGLEKISFPNSLLGIDICAFYGAQFKEVVIPNNVTYLGGGAFRNCSNLQKLVIPSSVIEIGEALLGWNDDISTILYVEKDSYAEKYAIENSLIYEIYEAKVEDDPPYIYDATIDNTISIDKINTMLKENETRDVIIHSNNNVTFSFAKGTMFAVENVEKYDFGTNIVSDFENTGVMPSDITEENFVTRINYNYSGKLPGTAFIKIFVGTEYTGKVLFYSKLLNDECIYITSSIVDEEGYIIVVQDSCSDYVLTLNEISADDNVQTPPIDEQKPAPITPSIDDEMATAPKTGDTSLDILCVITMFFILSCVLGKLKVKKN